MVPYSAEADGGNGHAHDDVAKHGLPEIVFSRASRDHQRKQMLFARMALAG
jgi:hypothetical protein